MIAKTFPSMKDSQLIRCESFMIMKSLADNSKKR